MDPSVPAVLVSSRRFRCWCSLWIALALAMIAVTVWLAVIAYSPATVMVITTEGFLAGYPLFLVRGRLTITAEEFQLRWPRSAAGPRIPWASVTAIELRRGLLLEKVQITNDRARLLAVPARFRYQADPVFDAAVAELARRSGCRVRSARRRLRLRWIAALWLAWLAALGFVTAIDAPWNDSSWPWRHEAAHLPDACAEFAGTARSLFPVSDETPDADVLMLGSVDTQDGCTWRDGPVNTFSIGLGLTHKGLFESASATAHTGLRNTVAGACHPDRTATPVPDLGDEAEEVTGRGGATASAAVDVIVRKANVIVTVRLITAHPDSDVPQAVEQIARSALAQITLR